MADVKIISEVAGRVCAIAAEAGAQVEDGDAVVMVEAMKMEIPAAVEQGGRVKEILVKIDEMIAEGQAVAIIEI